MSVGVVGCGLVAQVMHLPHLRKLQDRFEITWVCDLSPGILQAIGDAYGVEQRFTDWTEALDADADAVLVLTPGSHAPVVERALRDRRHVFVEKPLCFSVEEGRRLLEAAESAGVVAQVGYMKRYDPAFARLLNELRAVEDLRLVRVTTLESPIPPYVAHHSLVPAIDVDDAIKERLAADAAARAEAALGAARRFTGVYRSVLLDSLVHELNLLRAALGEPTAVAFASLDERRVGVVLRFGEIECVVAWVDLPGIARYEQEFAFYAPNRRLTLRFPSPFLRNMPTELVIEGGEAGTPRSWRTSETTSYEEAFERELRSFHEHIVGGGSPASDLLDGVRDVALCQAIVRAASTGRPVSNPTSL